MVSIAFNDSVRLSIFSLIAEACLDSTFATSAGVSSEIRLLFISSKEKPNVLKIVLDES